MAGEYRIIPVDQAEPSGDNAVNISVLLEAMRDQSGLIIKIMVGCLILGLLYAVFSPVQYTSQSKVLPEIGSTKQSQLGNLVQNYGGLLGADVGSINSSDDNTISPQIYPEIVQSLSFQYAMLQDTIYFADAHASMTLFHYFKPRVGWFYEDWFDHSDAVGTAQGLPDSLRFQLNSRQISSVSQKELEVIQVLRRRIHIQFDASTGVMSVTATMPDALAAAQVCKKAIDRLTKYVKEYRTQKAQHVLKYANKQYQIGKEQFKNAQSALADFEDQNVNLSTAKAQSRQKYLESEYNIAYNVYNSIAQKRVQAQMDLQKNTPIFETLQPANVPLQQASPQWIPIIFFAVVAGLVIAFLIIAGRLLFFS